MENDSASLHRLKMKHKISWKKCRFRIREKHVMNFLKDYDAQLRDEVAVESVVIIVLVSLLVTLLFFGKLLYFIFEKS